MTGCLFAFDFVGWPIRVRCGFLKFEFLSYRMLTHWKLWSSQLESNVCLNIWIPWIQDVYPIRLYATSNQIWPNLCFQIKPPFWNYHRTINIYGIKLNMLFKHQHYQYNISINYVFLWLTHNMDTIYNIVVYMYL